MGCAASLSALGAALVLAAGGDGGLRVGTVSDFPPYMVIDAAGQLAGSDYEMMQDICRRIGQVCHWQSVPFGDLIPGVMAGRFDVALGGMAINAERRRLVDFSDPYAEGGGFDWFVGRPGTPAPPAGTVAVVAGTIQETHARNQGFATLSFETEAAALAAVGMGLASLSLGPYDDRPDLAPLIEGAGLEPLYTAEVPSEGVGIALCKGNDALRARLNGALVAMFADGTMAAIESRWP